MRIQKTKRAILGISLLAVMGITLLTPEVEMNEVTAAPTTVAIDPSTFPDNAFREWVGFNCDKNFDGQLSDDEISQCTNFDVCEKGITNLKGIEYFPKLTTLRCNQNNLSSLDLRNNTALTHLSCSDNNLSSLDVSNNTALVYLDYKNNNISSLDLSNNTTMMYLDCTNNNISSLDLSNNTLTYLDCKNNNLNSLDLSNNTTMTYLDCKNNNLNSLDLSNNTALVYLDCTNNNLNSLDVSKPLNLQYLYCASNSLCSLDLSKNTSLNDFSGNTQFISAPMYKNGDVYYIDLSKLPLDSKRVSIDEVFGEADGTAYNSTFDRIILSDVKNVGDRVRYSYETNAPALSNTKMTVTLEISEVKDITEPTTEEPTTEEPTSEQPTTEQPSTEQPSTEQPTTEQPSTEQPTTEQPSTGQPSTEQPTTGQPTTEQPTTEQSTTQTGNDKDPAPKTGDTTPIYPVIFLLLASFTRGMTLYIRRKRS